MEALSLKWDLIKMEIRGFTIKYSKNKANERKSTEINLQNQINELYKMVENNPITSKLLTKFTMLDPA